MACNVTEQTIDIRNRNEEERNNNEKEEDIENQMKIITLCIEKNVNKEWSDTKAHMKL